MHYIYMIITTCSKTTKHVTKIFLLWTKSYFLPLLKINLSIYRSSPPQVLLEKGALKTFCKSTWEQKYRSAISIKLAASEFKEIWETFHIALRNLIHLIRSEINLFTILIIKSFIRKKEDTFDLQTGWWKIILIYTNWN